MRSYHLVYDQFKEWNIEESYKFETWFPNVIPNIMDFFQSGQQGYEKYAFAHLTPHLPEKLKDVTNDIAKVIPYWNKLAGYSYGGICNHVYKMFYCIAHDGQYLTLNRYDKNALLWATLYHDIAKRGVPEVVGKDNIHPFKSAWTALHSMQDDLKWINIKKEDWAIWDDIFNKAYMKRGGEIVQDHSYLKAIKEFLDKHVGDNKFIQDIIYLTLLHQSLPNMKEFKHKSIIHPLEDIRYYFDTRRMKLMKIFMQNDSISYTMYKSKHSTQTLSEQVNYYMDVLIRYLECLEIFEQFALDFGEVTVEEAAKKLPKQNNGEIMEQGFIEKMIVQFVSGDPVEETTDVILNFVEIGSQEHSSKIPNSQIFAKGGQSLQEEYHEFVKNYPTTYPGLGFATNAGDLKCKKIIHTFTTPLQPTSYDIEILSDCVVESLRLVEERFNGLNTVSIPLISDLLSGIDAKTSVEIIYQALKSYVDSKSYESSIHLVRIIGKNKDQALKRIRPF